MMQRLLDNLGMLIAEHDMAGLMRAVGCDREDLLDMLAELRQLDPKPGLAFDSGPVESVVPDVFVRRGADGAWQIELNTEILPRVLVNRVYYATVTKKARDAGRKDLPHRLPRHRQLADQEPRPARPDHPQGRRRDRAPAGRLPHPRHRPSASR